MQQYSYWKNVRREKISKYFSTLVVWTPDTSHFNQLPFILRYVLESGNEFRVNERFLSLVKSTSKTGKGISDVIIQELDKFKISISDCTDWLVGWLCDF